MLKQAPGWAAATLIAAFLAGGLVGWGVSSRLGHRRWGRGSDGGLFGARGAHGFLRRALDLTPAQEDSVRAILDRHRAEMGAIWRDVRPRFDSVRAAVDREIAAQLTPAQRPRFEKMVQRVDDRLRREPPPRGP